MSGTRRIDLSEAETALLIREAMDRTLALKFGPSGVWLNLSISPWALPILEKVRGQAFAEGAGI